MRLVCERVRVGSEVFVGGERAGGDKVFDTAHSARKSQQLSLEGLTKKDKSLAGIGCVNPLKKERREEDKFEGFLLYWFVCCKVKVGSAEWCCLVKLPTTPTTLFYTSASWGFMGGWEAVSSPYSRWLVSSTLSTVFRKQAALSNAE